MKRVDVPVLLLGGTTASGKTALSLQLAAATGAVVVNADAQQLYRDLPILTARPTPEEEAWAEHRLFGILGPEEETTAGRWLELVLPVLEEAGARGVPVILVGGTGLYMLRLLSGLAPVPPVPEDVRRRWREDPRPAPELHAELARRDPATAARLRPNDRQRILRALEVIEGTGRPLRDWQRETRPPVAFARLRGIALLPPRDRLWARIERRLDAMLRAGVLEEIRALAARIPHLRRLPLARLHGLREFLDHLEGRTTLEGARERTVIVTRQYAKRQSTFFRHQLPVCTPVEAFGEAVPQAVVEELRAFLEGAGGAASAGASGRREVAGG